MSLSLSMPSGRTLNPPISRVILVTALMAGTGILSRATCSESISIMEIEREYSRLASLYDTRVHDWKYFEGNPQGAEQVDYDDSAWGTCQIGFRWDTPDSSCWFRKRFVMPARIGGVDVTGAEVRLKMDIVNGGKVYVNGAFLGEFEWDEGDFVLTQNAQSGEVFQIAIEGINRPAWGGLRDVYLESSASKKVVPLIEDFMEEIRYALDLRPVGEEKDRLQNGVAQSLGFGQDASPAPPIEVLQSGDEASLQENIAQAKEVFMNEVLGPIAKEGQYYLDATKPLADNLARRIEEASAEGLDPSYQRTTLTVAREFQEFAAKDLAEKNARFLVRGRWNAQYIHGAALMAIREIEALIANPSLNRPVPRYRTGPVEIQNGVLYQNGHPVYLFGFGHFDQVRKDIPIFQDYGFNAVQLVLGVASVLVSPTEESDASVNALLAAMDQAAENNVAVDLLFEVHGWPRWAKKMYPELNQEDPAGFVTYKIDHPKARDLLDRYHKYLLPKIADHPALFSYCLMNEPTYSDRSEFSRLRFVAWLKGKHGTLEGLNDRWRDRLNSWEDVRIPSRYDDPGQWHDWTAFNRERFTEFHHTMRDEIRKYDPDTPMHTKLQAMAFDNYRSTDDGADPETFSQIDRIGGNDNWSYYRTWTDYPWIEEEYSTNWWRRAMFYDLQKSVAPENPIFNSENHPIEDDVPMWISARHIRTHYWLDALHGLMATTTWVWEHKNTHTLLDSILTRANCVEAAGHVALDLNRLAEYLVEFPRQKADVVLLWTPESIPNSDDYLDEIKKAYEGLYFLGVPIRFVTNRQAPQGGLADYKLVIAPNNYRVSDDVYQALTDYVRSGGTLVLSGTPFVQDEYGRPRRKEDLAILVRGEQPIQSLRSRREVHFRIEGAGDEPVRYQEYDVGSGKVCRIVGTSTGRKYVPLFDRLLDEVGATRLLRVTDEKGKAGWGVRHLSYKKDGAIVATLVNVGDDERVVSLNVGKPISHVTDLATGTEKPTIFELEPLDPILLEVR